MSYQSVSVVIPAYNCEATISQTIQAVLDQDYKGDVEVIIVDDGSTDQTAEKVKGFPTVRYVHQDNAGPAQARNHGLKMSTHAFVCFTDSDCVPHPDWIRFLLDGFDDPHIGVVSGSYGIANEGALLAFCIHREILYRHQALMSDFPKYFGSFNFCVKREVFEKVGGFDSKYRFASGEDNDLSYKISRQGYKIRFKRDALVDHHHTERVGKYLKEQFRHGYWRALLYRAHPAMMQGDGYTYWKDAVEVLLVLMVLLGVLLACFGLSGFVSLAFFLTAVLLGFEVISAAWFLRTPFPAFFFGVVLTLRSWARTLGLISGFFHFLKKIR